MQHASSLFRKAALEHFNNLVKGQILIGRTVKFNLILTAVSVLFVTLCLGVYSINLHRVETVSGFVKPQQDIVKIQALTAGVITKILVHNDQYVTQGTPLFEVQQPPSQQHPWRDIVELRAHFESQRQHHQAVYKVVEQAIQEDIVHTKRQQQTLPQRLKLLETKQAQMTEERLAAEQTLMRLIQLAGHDFVSEERVRQQRTSLQQLKQKQIDLALQFANHQEQQEALVNQLKQLEHQYRTQALAHEDKMMQSHFSEQQAEHAFSKYIVSTTDGVVTNIHHTTGQTVHAAATLLTILPHADSLDVVLLVPSKAFGFVEEGQLVSIRMDAFPHVKFGMLSGRVIHTGKSIFLPHELSAPVVLQEPVFRVLVSLDEPTFSGQPLPLIAGMTLQADIQLELRSVLEWILESLLAWEARV